MQLITNSSGNLRPTIVHPRIQEKRAALLNSTNTCKDTHLFKISGI